MRFPVSRPKAATLAGLSLIALVAACGHADAGRALADAPAMSGARGPAADYPVVLGAPFTVDGVTFTPADTMNYDAVGDAGVGSEGAGGISLAHRTLPLPSYVEVTSLRTGRTILVRAERRGPMSGSNLIELSPAAAAQLGIEGQHAPVRVRRVNPPEPERALLRSGQRAPERMDTPMSLVGVLMRKLEPAAPAPVAPVPVAPSVAASPSAPAVAAMPAAAKPSMPKPAALPAATATAAPAPVAKPTAPQRPLPKPAAAKPAASPRTPAPAAPANASGAYAVQVAAFSSPERAAEAARKMGGTVSTSGKFHRVRIGRYSSAAEAAGALAKARAAGYSDARIQRAD